MPIAFHRSGETLVGTRPWLSGVPRLPVVTREAMKVGEEQVQFAPGRDVAVSGVGRPCGEKDSQLEADRGEGLGRCAEQRCSCILDGVGSGTLLGDGLCEPGGLGGGCPPVLAPPKLCLEPAPKPARHGGSVDVGCLGGKPCRGAAIVRQPYAWIADRLHKAVFEPIAEGGSSIAAFELSSDIRN